MICEKGNGDLQKKKKKSILQLIVIYEKVNILCTVKPPQALVFVNFHSLLLNMGLWIRDVIFFFFWAHLSSHLGWGLCVLLGSLGLGWAGATRCFAVVSSNWLRCFFQRSSSLYRSKPSPFVS